jgi:hypothetical protein
MNGAQLIIIVFAIAMLYLTYYGYRRRHYDIAGFTGWSAVWVGVIVLVSFPSILYGTMGLLRIERTADFLVIMGFALFAAVIFKLYGSVMQTRKKVEDLVRNIAHEHPIAPAVPGKEKTPAGRKKARS